MAMKYVQRGIGVAVAVAAALAGVSCGDVARTGRSPVLLVIELIEASAGAGTTYTGFLLSDVVTDSGAVINDAGRATLRLVLKNSECPCGGTLTPSAINAVTITRYRVRFVRADGRNTAGVDIPYGFDGGVTVTIPADGTAQAVFDLVRHQSKREPPLSNMHGGGAQRMISTIAYVTFYGEDLAGNDIEATGTIQVNFVDFIDDPA
jgi:hypothetical protein